MIDLSALGDSIQAHGRVARIVIAGHRGSTPRESGAAMLVTAADQAGTIGGGRLEYRAVDRARRMLVDGPATLVQRQPLGPALGQCCGGSVTLVTEVWDAARYRAEVDTAHRDVAGIFARRVEGDAPLSDRVRRRLAADAAASRATPTQLVDGWLIEPVWRDRQPVCIYGAGHVGRALALVLTPLPRFAVTLADPRAPLFQGLPDTVEGNWTVPPHEIMAAAPPEAAHFIMTPDHDHDLELCHRLLGQRFAYAGLIGSATKWARFRKRLRDLGHSDARIDQIECPIGDPALGKHPQEIAVGVAARLLGARRRAAQREDVA
jgi:xanthine dehydrogenase accessory factor